MELERVAFTKKEKEHVDFNISYATLYHKKELVIPSEHYKIIISKYNKLLDYYLEKEGLDDGQQKLFRNNI